MVYLGLALVPGLPYLLIYVAYLRRLGNKRNTILALLSQPCVLDSYRARFGESKDDKEAVIARLFDPLYSWRVFSLPIGLTLFVITLGTLMALDRGGVFFGLHSSLESLVQRLPLTMFLGFAGAYTLGLYTISRLYRTEDLSPSDYHLTWIHIIVAIFAAPLLSQAFVPSAAYAVAFGVGVFPLKDSFDTVRDLAKKRLGVLSTVPLFEGSTLDKLQGLTEDVIERLDDEGITSSVQLAYADPIKLFVKTNFEWPFLIDIIDQALLFNYVKDIPNGLSLMRPLGIRGSIEMTVLGDPLSDSEKDGWANPQSDSDDQSDPDDQDDPMDPARVKQAIAVVASVFHQQPTAIRNLAINLWEDGQVDLVWQLFKTFENASSGKARPRRHMRGSLISRELG